MKMIPPSVAFMKNSQKRWRSSNSASGVVGPV
jgi:hypothetical protein